MCRDIDAAARGPERRRRVQPHPRHARRGGARDRGGARARTSASCCAWRSPSVCSCSPSSAAPGSRSDARAARSSACRASTPRSSARSATRSSRSTATACVVYANPAAVELLAGRARDRHAGDDRRRLARSWQTLKDGERRTGRGAPMPRTDGTHDARGLHDHRRCATATGSTAPRSSSATSPSAPARSAARRPSTPPHASWPRRRASARRRSACPRSLRRARLGVRRHLAASTAACCG